MTRPIAPLLLLALPLALSACKGGDKPAQDATAMGEVLPGTASDAMIPVDTVRSQAPLAPPPTGGAKGGARKGGEDDDNTVDVGPGAEDAPSISLPAPDATE